MDNATEGFTSVSEFHSFMFGGKATFTMTSQATGEHFTFTLREWKKRPGIFFLKVKAPHGELDMGMVRKGRLRVGVVRTDRTEVGPDAPSAKAFDWLVRVMAEGRLPRTATIQHDGRCGVCARQLTHPESLRNGIGPDCAGRLSCEAA